MSQKNDFEDYLSITEKGEILDAVCDKTFTQVDENILSVDTFYHTIQEVYKHNPSGRYITIEFEEDTQQHGDYASEIATVYESMPQRTVVNKYVKKAS